MRRIWFLVICLGFNWVVGASEVAPVEIGKITLLKTSGELAFPYDVYLPKQYDPAGTRLPLVFTSNPGGGGMTKAYQGVADALGLILVGHHLYKNGYDENRHREIAIELIWSELDQWLTYDPKKVVFAGFSGGGLHSFAQTKNHRERIAAVFSVGGWLGNAHDEVFDRYAEGLIVARSNGVNDNAARSWLPGDKAFLDKFGAVVKDFDHPGGHGDAPTATKIAVFEWIFSQINEIPEDEKKAKQLAAFVEKMRDVKPEVVVWTCLKVINETPRSQQAKVAHQSLISLFSEAKAMRKLSLHPKLAGESGIKDYLLRKARLYGLLNQMEHFESFLHFALATDALDYPKWCEKLTVLYLLDVPRLSPSGKALLKAFNANYKQTDTCSKVALMGQGLLQMKMKKWPEVQPIVDQLNAQASENKYVKAVIKQLEDSHQAESEQIERKDWLGAAL